MFDFPKYTSQNSKLKLALLFRNLKPNPRVQLPNECKPINCFPFKTFK